MAYTEAGHFNDLHVITDHERPVLKPNNWLVYEQGKLRSVSNHEFKLIYQPLQS